MPLNSTDRSTRGLGRVEHRRSKLGTTSGTLLTTLNYSIGRDSGQAADAFKLLKMFVKGKGAFLGGLGVRSILLAFREGKRGHPFKGTSQEKKVVRKQEEAFYLSSRYLIDSFAADPIYS